LVELVIEDQKYTMAAERADTANNIAIRI